MRYKIFSNGEHLNTIEATAEFIKSFTDETGYTAELVPEDPPTPEPSAEEDLEALVIDHEYRLTLLELGVE